MFPMMNPNPIRVTMFGASHSGKSLTKAFHCLELDVSDAP
jgi:hypothetical protein